MRRLSLLLIAYLLILFPPVVLADRIDDYIEARMRREHIPGLSLAIVQNGKVIRLKGYGYADLENRVRTTPDTVFRLASLSKQFTATAILRLVEEEKIGLDDSITRYLKGVPEAWEPITLRHLLTHTSGLSDVDGIPGFSFRKDYTTEEFLREMGRLPLQSAPGERLVYCSSGYHMLGLVVEKVSGKPYEAFLQERFFQPLKMTSTGAWSVQKIVPNRAAGYEWENGAFQKSEYLRPRVTAPGGGVLASVRDLAAWDLALQANKPLRADSLKQMTTPGTLRDGSTIPAGFGWFISVQRGHKLIQHNGSTSGFSTTLDRYVDDHLTLIVLCNGAGIDAEDIARRIAGLVRPELRQTDAE